MSNPRTTDDGLAPEARNSPMVGVGYNTATFLAWLGEDRRNPIMTGLGCALLLALLALLVMTSRPAETTSPPDMGSVPIYATAKQGQGLVDVGEPFGVDPLQMVALNIKLIEANTERCKRMGRTTGICEISEFAGRKLAWNALWAGDRAVVGIKQVELPTTAMTSNAR